MSEKIGYETPLLFSGDVTSTLADLRRQRAAIDNNPLLSEAGKRGEFDKLEIKRQSEQAKALDKFTMDWDAMKTAYLDLKAKREQIAEEAAKRWDYSRLVYNRDSAVGMIRKAQSPQDVLDGYEAVRLSGDRHAQRAYSETAASLIGASKQFSSDPAAASDLQRKMQREAERLTTPPEMEAHKQKESKLSGEIAKLYQRTKEAANEFYPAHAMYGTSNPLTDLLKGVTVTQKVDSASWGTTTSVDLDWD